MKISAVVGFASTVGAYAVSKAPSTVVIDGQRLVDAKAKLLLGEQRFKQSLEHLVAQADVWLDQGPWTVTSKSEAPPNGTLHDYASQAPYYWPNPNTPDGCPYIQRDGERNPEVDKYTDRLGVGRMFNSTYTLSLAWWYTGEEKYSRHAARIIKTWFLDEETAMSPNLNHAQIVPCANDGRSIGIIDFSQEYTNVLDAVAILSTGAPGWVDADLEGFKSWNVRFTSWLVDSPFGQKEASQSNNHGTFANMQISALALFTGNLSLAKTTAKLAPMILDTQIASDGYQPQETARTRSWHYSNFNLGAHLRWALIAKKVGIDLYAHRGNEGQSLFKAVAVTIPAAIHGSEEWPFKDLEFTQYAATDNIHAAADAGLCRARKAATKLQPPPGGDIYLLRPAPQQLDSIVTL